MNENLVRILYFSPLEKPRIHFSICFLQDESIGSQHWDQYAMKKTTSRHQLYEIELLLDSDQYLEFVFCGGEGDRLVWENPRGDQAQKYARRGNFFVDITGVFAIFDGFIFPVLPPPVINQPLAIFTDIDGTLIGNHTSILNEFKKFFIGYGLLDHPKVSLVYSTGRGIENFKKILKEAKLIIPDYLIASCGTEVYSIDKKDLTFKLNDEWKDYITAEGKDWNLKALYSFVSTEFPELIINDQQEQSLFKGQFIVQEQNVKDKLRLDVNSNFKLLCKLFDFVFLQKMIKDASLSLGTNWKYIITGKGPHRFVDILPQRADKGTSLRFLCKRVLQCDQSCTVAFGDSLSDIDMLIQAGRGFAVANSQPDLLQWLQENFALYPTISLSPYQESETITRFLQSSLKIKFSPNNNNKKQG